MNCKWSNISLHAPEKIRTSEIFIHIFSDTELSYNKGNKDLHLALSFFLSRFLIPVIKTLKIIYFLITHIDNVPVCR